MTEDWRNGGFGLYIHWPFCAAKCPYCDFNSHVRASIDHAEWQDAYLDNLTNQAAKIPNRKLNAIFFGGGTPSLMDPKTVGALIQKADELWGLEPDAEVTLEANPTSVEADKFADFKSAGVNRVSMGIQSLNDADLKRLGRMHSAKEALAAFEIARSCFQRVSFDLIYARQDQTLRDWEQELQTALDLAVDHLSLYQLTIEQGTRFGDIYNLGRLKGLPSDSLSADMYSATQEICAKADMSGYEVSNYARAGAESVHNLIYWRYGDYVGVGPGAHGRISIAGKRLATSTELSPEQWLKNPNHLFKEEVSPREQAIEYLMMSLRLNEGTDLVRYRNLSGTGLNQQKLTLLEDQGMITNKDDRIVATERGRILLNSVLTELLS